MGLVTRWSVRLAALCAGFVLASANATAAEPSVNSLDPNVESAPTLSQATAEAKALGDPVLAESTLTEMSAVFANPDGTRTAEVFTDPVRTEDDAAPTGWRPLDLNLAFAADGVRPNAPANDTWLSAGGLGNVFARVALASGTAEFSLPGMALPVPLLSGDTATYPSVQPGVDLQVRATNDGIKVSFVVASKPAAVLTLPVVVRASALSVRETSATPGGLEFVDDAGQVVGQSQAPVMFDQSPLDPDTDDTPNRVPVSTTVTPQVDGVTLELRPDAAYFDRASLKYPVVIDPDIGITRDTFVASASPANATSQNGLGLKVGVNSLADITRILMRFATDDSNGSLGIPAGAVVDTATVSLYMYEIASSCDATRTFRVYGIQSLFSEGEYWNVWASNTPAGLPTHDPTYYASGTVSCTINQTKTFSGGGQVSPDHASLVPLVQGWVNGNPFNKGIIIKANVENTADTRRHFRDSEYATTTQRPKLTVTYRTNGTAPTVTSNSHPNPPGNWSSNTNVTTSWTGSADMSGATSTLWEWKWDSGAVSSQTVAGTTWLNHVVAAPNMSASHTLSVRSTAVGGVHAGVVSAWATFVVKIDTTAPSAPAVTSSTHTDVNTWYESPAFAASWIAADSGGSGLASYRWKLDQTKASPTSGWSSGSSIPPGTLVVEGVQYLHAQAVDGAGNAGTWALFPIHTDLGGAGDASAQIGPCSVHLVSGNCKLVATDVSIEGPRGGLSVSRSYDSRGSGATGGPGWVFSVPGGAADGDWSKLIEQPSGAVDVVASDGSLVQFTLPSPGQYVLSVDDTEANVSLSKPTSASFVLTDDRTGDVTTFTRPTGGGPATQYAPTLVVSKDGATQHNSYSWRLVDGLWVPTPDVAAAPNGPGVTDDLHRQVHGVVASAARMPAAPVRVRR